MALTEMLETSSSDHLEAHEDMIVEAVRTALIDEDSEVRVAAARTFDALQETFGTAAIDQTIPTLLEAMSTPGEIRDCLDGLEGGHECMFATQIVNLVALLT